jgi:hypothetical protein
MEKWKRAADKKIEKQVSALIKSESRDAASFVMLNLQVQGALPKMTEKLFLHGALFANQLENLPAPEHVEENLTTLQNMNIIIGKIEQTKIGEKMQPANNQIPSLDTIMCAVLNELEEVAILPSLANKTESLTEFGKRIFTEGMGFGLLLRTENSNAKKGVDAWKAVHSIAGRQSASNAEGIESKATV